MLCQKSIHKYPKSLTMNFIYIYDKRGLKKIMPPLGELCNLCLPMSLFEIKADYRANIFMAFLVYIRQNVLKSKDDISTLASVTMATVTLTNF